MSFLELFYDLVYVAFIAGLLVLLAGRLPIGTIPLLSSRSDILRSGREPDASFGDALRGRDGLREDDM